MIESIMYFAIGFFAAGLSVLIVVPAVHGRAVRLNTRRLEAALPASMAEVRADKDLLRAEFAVATRRSELKIEQLTTNSASQLAELGRKADAINRLKIECDALRDQLRASEETAAVKVNAARERTLADKESELAALASTLDERAVLVEAQKDEITALTVQIQKLKEQLAQATEEARAEENRRAAAAHDADRALSAKESELAALTSSLDERAALVDAQNAEIAALTVQIQKLKEQLAQADAQTRSAELHRAAERSDLDATTDLLTEERAKFDDFHRRIAELVQRLSAQTAKDKLVARQTEENLQRRVVEQSRLLQDHQREVNYFREEIAIARQSGSDLQIAAQNFSAENSRLQGMLDRANGERARLTYELANMRREKDSRAA
jgi:chromosome segregation ATPase